MEVYRLYDDTDRAANLPEAQRACLEITTTDAEVAIRFCNGPEDFGREFYLTQESAANLGHLLAMVAGEPLPEESGHNEDAAREIRRRENLMAGVVLTIAGAMIAAFVTATVLLYFSS